MKEDLNLHYSNKDVEIHKTGSEIFELEKESIDFCFTSPPYFNLELYSEEITQSHIKYSNTREWVNGFLKKTFQNVY